MAYIKENGTSAPWSPTDNRPGLANASRCSAFYYEYFLLLFPVDLLKDR